MPEKYAYRPASTHQGAYICHTHTLTHSLTLAPSLARTHSPSRSFTPTHSHIGVSHLLAAGAGPLPLPSVHDAVVESLGGGGFGAMAPPSTPHPSEPWPLAGGMLTHMGAVLVTCIRACGLKPWRLRREVEHHDLIDNTRSLLYAPLVAVPNTCYTTPKEGHVHGPPHRGSLKN